MNKRWLACFAMLVSFGCSTFAQVPAVSPVQWGYADTYQVNVLQNLQTVDAVINLENAGFYTPFGNTFPGTGYLCANIYVFGGVAPADPSGEQLAACCTCPISRNGVRSVRASQLIFNPLTRVNLNAASIKVVWTTPRNGVDDPASCGANVAGANNAPNLPATNVIAGLTAGGTPTNNGGFATGGRAWATHWHTIPGGAVPGLPNPLTPVSFGTETRFADAPLSSTERTVLQDNCRFTFGNGSGSGICSGCPTGGAQGASKL